jgi:hypothetical protein
MKFRVTQIVRNSEGELVGIPWTQHANEIGTIASVADILRLGNDGESELPIELRSRLERITIDVVEA